MRMSFNESLHLGNLGELIVRDYLENQPWVRNIVDVRMDKLYQQADVDFLVENQQRQFKKLEVKTDFQAHKSGNIVYELSTSNHVGCFEKTKADIIAYYIPDNQTLHLIDVKELRKYVYDVPKDSIHMGDNAEGVLLKISELEQSKVIIKTYKGVY